MSISAHRDCTVGALALALSPIVGGPGVKDGFPPKATPPLLPSV